MTSARPDPAELHAVSVQVEQAVADVIRAVGRAASAGIIIDDEIAEAVAVVTSWAAWVTRHAVEAQR